MQRTANKIEVRCDNCGTARIVLEYFGDSQDEVLAYAEAGWKMVVYRAGDGPYDYYDSSDKLLDLCPKCSSIASGPTIGMFNRYGR